MKVKNSSDLNGKNVGHASYVFIGDKRSALQCAINLFLSNTVV